MPRIATGTAFGPGPDGPGPRNNSGGQPILRDMSGIIRYASLLQLIQSWMP